MAKSLTSGIRMAARDISCVMLFVMLVPLFLGLMPRPAVSAAEAGFQADVLASLCTPTGPAGNPASQDGATGNHGCCVLCASPGLPRLAQVSVPADFEPVSVSVPVRTAYLERFDLPPPQGIATPTRTSRGPPA
jgi:hypothetical protein